MTEAEWLACSEPSPMLQGFRDSEQARQRKLRLFAVACCRLMFLEVPVPAVNHHMVDVAERYADGTATFAELQDASTYPNATGKHVACGNAAEVEPYDSHIGAADAAAGNAAWAIAKHGEPPPNNTFKGPGPDDDVRGPIFKARWAGEEAKQAVLVRDIFGNPFRPVTFDPEWRSDTALSLARHIYEARDFAQMPILADALQDAGCDNADILSHCRDPHQVHVRGCWVVDLSLGKS